MAYRIKVMLSRVFVLSKMSETRRNNKRCIFFKNIDFMRVVFSSLIIKDTTTHINKVGTESCSFNLAIVHKANTPKSIYLFSEQTCKSIRVHHAVFCYQLYMQAQKDYAVHVWIYIPDLGTVSIWQHWKYATEGSSAADKDYSKI